MGSLTIHLFLFDFERVLVGGKGGGVEGERVLGIPEQDGHHWLEEQDQDGDVFEKGFVEWGKWGL